MTNFAVDCVWADWKISQCSVTCGGGTRTNTRSKTVEEKNNGVCIGDPTTQEVCNDQSCPGKIVLYLIYSICYILFYKVVHKSNCSDGTNLLEYT